MTLTTRDRFVMTEQTKRMFRLVNEIDRKLGQVQQRALILHGKMLCEGEHPECQKGHTEGEDRYTHHYAQR